MMISGSRPSPHTRGPRPFRQTPFCQTVRTVSQTGSAHLGLKSVPCKNLRTAGCSKNESFWRSRRWTHIPTKLHRGRLSPAVCKGAAGSNCPHGTPKGGKKKGLDSVAGEKKWSQKVCLTHRGIFTKAMSYRMASYDRDTFPFARSCLCMHVVLLEAKAGLS